MATNNISKGDLLMRINASNNNNNNNTSQVVLLDSYTLAGTHCGVCLNESADLFLCKCNKIYICTNCKHVKKECNAYSCMDNNNNNNDTTLLRQLIRILSNENYNKILDQLSILEHHYSSLSIETKEKYKQTSMEALKLTNNTTISSSSSLLLHQLILTSARFSANEILISHPFRWRKSSIFNLGTENIGIGVFINASFANHSCTPNCHYVFEDGATFLLIALENIAIDQEITISYTSLYQSTKNRQIELEETYNFKCNCIRCIPLLKDKIQHKIHFDQTIDEIPSPSSSNNDILNIYDDLIERQQEAFILIESNDNNNTIGSARQILQSANVKKLTRYLSSKNNIILHATRMMQLGLAHVQNDHMYVNSWVEKIKNLLIDASMYNEYCIWILLLNVIQLFHNNVLEDDDNNIEDNKYLNEVKLLYGEKTRNQIYNTLQDHKKKKEEEEEEERRRRKKKKKMMMMMSNKKRKSRHNVDNYGGGKNYTKKKKKKRM